ncbi:MAG: hypothetical protein HPY54_00265 [Chthonomonadetes bacterium]|nr:hypothetical protein [Chthonomonadetes bacterium]
MQRQREVSIWVVLAVLPPLLLWACVALSMLLFSLVLGTPIGEYTRLPAHWYEWLLIWILAVPLSAGIYLLLTTTDTVRQKKLTTFLVIYFLFAFLFPNLDRLIHPQKLVMDSVLMLAQLVGMGIYVVATYFVAIGLNNIKDL